jgi:uncharacterized protein (TIGR03790 family)
MPWSEPHAVHARGRGRRPGTTGRAEFAALALALALAAAALLPSSARALEPDEVLVLVDGVFGDGGAIFERLRERRGVPKENLVLLRGTPDAETIPRRAFERHVLAPLRAELSRAERARIRCLVTTRGLPLRVAAVEPERGAPKPATDPATTVASFDSELALLLCPPPALEGWVANPLRRFGPPGAPAPPALGAARPLMVARIDAPTRALALGLIQRALEAERDGLEGTFCFDARGLDAGARGYGRYDQRIRDAAKLAREAGLAVRLEDTPALFAKGDCPGAAFYVGWYSLMSYVDAFDFETGALGFHVASGEAASLQHGDAWVKGMLEDGITATLGPTDEPYLDSFPDPVAFLARALDGRRTLAEIYWETVPHASWRQLLIGDPFYRPRIVRPGARPADGAAK